MLTFTPFIEGDASWDFKRNTFCNSSNPNCFNFAVAVYNISEALGFKSNHSTLTRHIAHIEAKSTSKTWILKHSVADKEMPYKQHRF